MEGRRTEGREKKKKAWMEAERSGRSKGGRKLRGRQEKRGEGRDGKQGAQGRREEQKIEGRKVEVRGR